MPWLKSRIDRRDPNESSVLRRLGRSASTKLSLHFHFNEMIMNLVPIVLLALATASCTTDITKDPVDMTDFVVGQTYELKKPAYIWKSRLMPRELADSEGMLAPGTRLTIRKVQVDRSPEMGTVTDVLSEVTTGQFKGRSVNVTWISKILKSGYTKRNPEMLEPVPGESK